MVFSKKFISQKKDACDLIRFGSGFWGLSGKTKITRANAYDIIHMIAEATEIPVPSLIVKLAEIYPRYEEGFKIEQFNRLHGVGIPQAKEVYWPPEIDPIQEGLINEKGEPIK